MNPISIDHDYLMLRIGRLTVNLEAALTQRDAALRQANEQGAEVEKLKARVSELEDLVKILDDEADESEEDGE